MAALLLVMGAGSMFQDIVDNGPDQGLPRHADRFPGRFYRRAPALPLLRVVRLGILRGLGAETEIAGAFLDLLDLPIGWEHFARDIGAGVLIDALGYWA